MRWSSEQYRAYVNQKMPSNSKYKNQKTEVDGIVFDSKREAEYYMQLKYLKRIGEIKDFGIQQKYELQPKFKKNGKTYQAIAYIADFVFVNKDGSTEVVDIKGVETKEFKIKYKMFEFKYPELTLKIIKYGCTDELK
jgi:hypothetical protein